MDEWLGLNGRALCDDRPGGGIFAGGSQATGREGTAGGAVGPAGAAPGGQRIQWMPHSVLPESPQRPARASSPAATRAVQGAQPIDG